MSTERHLLSSRSRIVKQLALNAGFSFCGISKAEQLGDEARHLEEWLNRGYNGKMGYMENHFEKRIDPTLLVPGSKSVISLLFNYHNPDKPVDESAPRISQYAYGEDYHHVLKRKMHALTDAIEKEFGAVEGRVFVDSAPVLDKAWAARSGLGWIGKHSNLLNREGGSYFFIAEIISDLELEADGPVKDHCGTCTACLDACPTDAIVEPYLVDGSKCISYFTIELRDSVIPEQVQGKFENWAFGCDICQEVCPWNRFATRHQESAFDAHPKLLELKGEEWQELSEEVFRELFRKSAVKRAGYDGLKRNLRFLSPPSQDV